MTEKPFARELYNPGQFYFARYERQAGVPHLPVNATIGQEGTSDCPNIKRQPEKKLQPEDSYSITQCYRK